MAKYLFILLCVLSIFASANLTQAKARKAKVDKLRVLSSLSSGMVKLNTTGYYHYVVDEPRPYILVVYFTADVAKFKCQQCETIQALLQQVIYSYKESETEKASDDFSHVPVFFAEMEYTPETQEIFQKHEFMSAPNLFVSKPNSVINGKVFSVKKEDMWEFNMGSEVHAYKLLEFINNRSGRDIEMKTPPLEALMMVVYMGLMIVALSVIVYRLKGLLLVPYMWLFGSVLIYFICISGVVYDIIHGVPMVGMNQKTGAPEIIHTGQRSQYGAEGFIMGFLITMGGLGIVALNLIKSFTPNRIRLFGTAILIAVIYAGFTIFSVYKMKARWYGPGFYPPDYYTRGSLIKDQGYSF